MNLGRLSERNKKYNVGMPPIDIPDDNEQMRDYDPGSDMPKTGMPLPDHNIDYEAADYFDATSAREMINREKRAVQQEDDYGDTRSPVKLATEIERDSTPKGAFEIMIGGRPIDLHQLENYMVWKTSPYVIKTLMRYNNAKTLEEVKNYSSRRRGGGSLNLKSLMLILLCVGMAIAGVVMVMFMPQIMAFFKGFGGF